MKPLINSSLMDTLCWDISFVTGSTIIGGFTVGSDLDIVVPIDTISATDQWLNEFVLVKQGTMERSSYNNGVKLHFSNNISVNVLRLHPLDYCAFMFATDTLMREPIINNRNVRHRAFEELCHAFKSFIGPHYVTLDKMHSYAHAHDDAPFMTKNIDWENFYARQP